MDLNGVELTEVAWKPPMFPESCGGESDAFQETWRRV